MSSSFVQLYRQFPTSDPANLQRELIDFHTQTNVAVNQRTIGNFQLHVGGDIDSAPNGERWFPVASQSLASPLKLRDGFRLVVQVSDAVLTVNHNIPLINQATRLYGTFFDGTSWQVLPYVDVVAAANQIRISVTSTQVVVVKGAGAPSISSGLVIFEYL